MTLRRTRRLRARSSPRTSRAEAPETTALAVPKPVSTGKAQRRALQRRKRALSYGGSDDWPALKEAVYARDRYRCVYCGADGNVTGLEPAHLKSVGMGGRRAGTPDALNEPKWVAALCPTHAEASDTGADREHIREAVKRKLARLHGYTYDLV